jgi:hypothetical protein
MAKRRITLTWEGEFDDESVELCKADVTECVEFLIDREDAVLTIEEAGSVIFRYAENEGANNE